MMDYFDLLQKLTETPGPSGFEGRVAATITDLWQPYVDEVVVDRLGSVIATRYGAGDAPRQRLMLAAHLDEIGLMVTELKEYSGYGFLRVINLGGVDIRHLYAQRVMIHGRRDLPAVLASLPARLLPKDRRTQPYGYEDLVVDPGIAYDELLELVEIGDAISFQQPLRKLLNSNVSGKALDNRASVAAVTICLDKLKERHHAWDVVAVATAQEETRLLGAYTSAFAQQPDAAIAIDVSFAKGAGLTDSNLELDGGPILDLGPNIHPGMLKALQDEAKALEMDVMLETHSRASGTDAYGLQVARSGIPTGLISIPLRYMHTMVEVVNTNDLERVGRLLTEFIARLDGEFLHQLSAEMMDA